MKKNNFFRMSKVNDNINKNGYYSCHDIEGSVTFLHGYLTMCCHVHNTNKGMPYLTEYKGGKIPVETIKKARNELIDKNQTDEDTPCKGCEFLEKREWEKSDYLINNISIGHYTPCNLRCNYCYITDYSPEETKKFNTRPYNMAESIKFMKKQNLLNPHTTAWLSGGEPTIFSDFKESMELFIDNNVYVTLGTNCTIPTIDIVKKGIKKGIVEILCSVDAGTKEMYTKIKGKDKYETVWSILKEYIAVNDENIVVKYIFMIENCNKEEVESFIDKCVETKIRKISISRDVRQHKGVLSVVQNDMPVDMLNGIVLMYKLARKNNIEVYFDINWPVFKDEEIENIKWLSNND